MLDPGRLRTVQQATALLGSADSIQQAFTGQITAVDPRPLIDSAGALSARLAGANPARLGISGTRDAVQSVRRTLRAVDSMRLRLAALQQSGEAGVARLRGGLSSLDDARRQDYDFARSLLQLPRFDAPNIGPALFGQVSIDRFQQVAYWSELVQHYLPPGLRPQQRSGPKRLRRAGTTVLFPKEREYPSFLLRNGELNLALDIGGARHTLQAAVAGVTTQPTLYGHPATVTADGTIGGAHPLSLRVNALVDHTGTVSHDALGAFLGGVHLPAFAVPGLPFKVDPGLGSASLTFSREGDQIVGRWTLRSANAAWTRDSAGGAGQDPVGNLIWQVVSGLQHLQVTAEIKGTLRSPTLSVHSNLDEAIATRLRTLLGEEVARAEAKARAEMDRLVSTQVGAARARVDTYKQLVDERVSQVQQQLDKVKADLESRLRSLTGGLGGILGS